MSRRAIAWILVLIAVGGAAVAWRWRTPTNIAAGGVLITGGDGGGLPRTEPKLEGFDAEALASAASAQRNASELLITRHGHLVYERYAHGADLDTLIEGGELDRALLIIAAGIAVAQHGMSMPAPPVDGRRLADAVAAAGGRSYPEFLSRYVWQPIHAGPARWSPAGVSARGVDWLRVAELLLHDGRFEGTQVVRAGWIHAALGFGNAAQALSLQAAAG